jgi:hypothetical protein
MQLVKLIDDEVTLEGFSATDKRAKYAHGLKHVAF